MSHPGHTRESPQLARRSFQLAAIVSVVFAAACGKVTNPVNGGADADPGPDGGAVVADGGVAADAMSGSCGDGVVDLGEDCDDGNTVTEACAYGVPSCLVCTANCTRGPGLTSVCGDGQINGPETCDDGNTVTETCAYGQTSCTVCRANCTSGAGTVVGYCGDGVVNGPEQCESSTNQTCTSQGFVGGVIYCSSCSLDTSSCYANTPQITTIGLQVIGFGTPETRWPQANWTIRTIYVDPKGNLVGNLSGSYIYSYTDVVPMLKLNVQYAPPSTAYKLRVYRTMQGDFSLGNLSWVGYADYTCNDGGNLAEYCTAGTDRKTPYLDHNHFTLPY